MKFLYLVKESSEGIVKEVFSHILEFYSSNNYDYSKIYHFGISGLQNLFASLIFTNLIKKDSFIPPHFYTLKEFALTILEKEGILREYKTINENLKPIIILNLLEDKEKEKVTFGYSVILSQFISELKQYYYNKEIKDSLLKKIETYPKAYENLEFAFKIKERYEEYLKKNKLLDEEDCQYLANEIIKEKKIILPFLVINGFIDFTNLEKELIATLIKNSEKTFVILLVSESKTTDFYLSCADFTKIEYQKESITEEELLKLPIHAYSTIEEEIEGILKRIKLRHLRKEKNLSSVVLVSANLRKYHYILERVFRRLDLPYGIFKTVKLKDLPPFSFLIEVLKTIDENYPRLKTSLIFSLPYLEAFSPETRRYVNFLSKMARIIYGKSDWLSLKNILLKSNDLKIKELIKRGVVDKVMKDIENFFELSEELTKNNYLNEFISDFRKFLNQLKFLKKGNYNEIVYEGLLKFYEILSHLEDFAIPVDFPKFIKIIDYHFSYTPIRIEKEFSGIKVIDLHDLVVWDFSFIKDCEFYLFGLVEEDLPGRYHPEPLIPEYLKKEFNLPNSDLHLFRERSYLYSFLKTVQKNCYLSTHNYESENPILLTPFLEGEKIKPEEIKPILSVEDFQILKGKKEIPFFDIQKTEISLKNWATKENPLSITQLVKYLKCPFQFYLEEVIGLSSEEERSVAIERWEWGKFVHSVMQKLYQTEVPEIDKLPEVIKQKVNETLIEEVSFELLPIWKDFITRLFEKMIPQILDVEKDLRKKGFLPWPAKMEYSIKGEILDGIYLKGRIDRIDKSNSGVFIIDYKTGTQKPFSLSQMKQEKDLIQIFAYAYLWNKINDLKCENLGIYYLPEGKLRTPKEKEIKEMEEYLLSTVKESIERLRKGDFSVDRVDKSKCYMCSYQFLCGRE
ncbi:MAG: PD-(D/E)XK nuclease family protein [candidate division WOR-3 bacterium]